MRDMEGNLINFSSNFLAGYYSTYEIAFEQLSDRSVAKAVKHAIAVMEHNARKGLFGEETEQQIRARRDYLMRISLSKCEATPDLQPIRLEDKQLPESVFTHVAVTDHQTLLFTMVFGGILKNLVGDVG